MAESTLVRPSAALFVALTSALTLLSSSATAVRAAAGGDGGTAPFLVRSRVPLTPEVAAAIGAHANKVTFVWPEIRSMAMIVNPSRMAELLADPLVDLVEPDQQGQAPGRDPADAYGAAPPLVSVPLPQSGATNTPWNQDMADTAGSGYDGTGVTVAVVDSGLPQNWEEFLPPGVHVDLEHAVGFGAEGWGDFHATLNAVRGVGGHIGQFPHGLAVSSVITGFPSDGASVGGAAPGVT
ncbi:MAG TPA: hypothetical protein VJV75_05840, partial [Candidatus Polarisedimenticolia bacterium]|nr:hypothetical protein [Candidatus Polarisedimenticolia bacterium]